MKQYQPELHSTSDFLRLKEVFNFSWADFSFNLRSFFSFFFAVPPHPVPTSHVRVQIPCSEFPPTTSLSLGSGKSKNSHTSRQSSPESDFRPSKITLCQLSRSFFKHPPNPGKRVPYGRFANRTFTLRCHGLYDACGSYRRL